MGKNTKRTQSDYRRKYGDYLGIEIPSDCDVHHMDCNRQNNDMENLVYITKDLHIKYHLAKCRVEQVETTYGVSSKDISLLYVDPTFNFQDFASGKYLRWWKGNPEEFERMCYEQNRIARFIEEATPPISQLKDLEEKIRLEKYNQELEMRSFLSTRSPKTTPFKDLLDLITFKTR